MKSLAERSTELYELFEEPTPAEELDLAFCRALATALDATEVLLFEKLNDSSEPVCLCAWENEPRSEAEKGLAQEQRPCGTAALTGQIASLFENHPDDPERGSLRLAVPVAGKLGATYVMEIVKIQQEPHPREADLFLLQTFGGLYAARDRSLQSAVQATANGSPGVASPSEFPEPIGKSSSYTRAQLLAVKAARAECRVLILGETGTGKELVARQLHEASRRRGKPYIAINCGALSDTILESEFFGHVRGAFTGAYRSRKGKLEEANGGTVFLDEVAEMTPTCQVKLLRTLDTGEITPLGSNKSVKINVRFIAATHQNLEALIQQGKFREDLFYRLQGMRIELPPLRRRRGDAELLANFFLQQETALQESPARGFTPQAMERLKAYDWPGNVRELKQVIGSAVAMAEGEWIEVGDLPPSLTMNPSLPIASSAPPQPDADERSRILHALNSTAYPGTGRWNLRAAARSLSMNHQTFGYKVRKVYRLTNG